MKCHMIVVVLAATVAMGSPLGATASGAETKDATAQTAAGVEGQMKLWKEIDIAPYKTTFPCLGDLDNDGRVDFLLYRQGPRRRPAIWQP